MFAKTTLVGRVSDDPRVSATKAGKPMATLSVYTEKLWTKPDGSVSKIPAYHRVVCWGSAAEEARSLRKDVKVLIEGELGYWRKEVDGGGKVYQAQVSVNDQNGIVVLSAGDAGGAASPGDVADAFGGQVEHDEDLIPF